jgi:NAD(P)-dependent dehydrogenase (short-subunit alcohol dehydrogenase family)
MAYRVAKTALNQVTMTFARDFEKQGRKVTVVNVEPGFVATRLTGYDFVDDMDTCIAGLVKGIQAITNEDNGQFISWSGNRLRY